MEHVYEVFFFLKYYGGWSLTEMYSLPVGLRKWFSDRLQKQLKDEAEERRKAHRKAKSKR
tara:strand:- start:436 stop:615 length:180 start_codon:yes stop_codon:yes gene_type:complete